ESANFDMSNETDAGNSTPRIDQSTTSSYNDGNQKILDFDRLDDRLNLILQYLTSTLATRTVQRRQDIYNQYFRIRQEVLEYKLFLKHAAGCLLSFEHESKNLLTEAIMTAWNAEQTDDGYHAWREGTVWWRGRSPALYSPEADRDRLLGRFSFEVARDGSDPVEAIRRWESG